MVPIVDLAAIATGAFARLGYDPTMGNGSYQQAHVPLGDDADEGVLSISQARDGRLVLRLILPSLPRGSYGAAQRFAASWVSRHRWPDVELFGRTYVGVVLQSHHDLASHPLTDDLLVSWLDTFVGQAVKIHRGLARTAGRSPTFTTLSRSPGVVRPTCRVPLDSAVGSLAWDASGRLWVGTDAGLRVLTPVSPSWERCSVTRAGGVAAPVNSLAVDPRTGRVAAGTDDGLYLYDPDLTATCLAQGTGFRAVAWDPSHGWLAALELVGATTGFAFKGLGYAVALWRPPPSLNPTAPPDVLLPLDGYPGVDLAFSQDGTLAVGTTNEHDDGVVLAWNSQALTHGHDAPHVLWLESYDEGRATTWGPSGHLAVASGCGYVVVSPDPTKVGWRSILDVGDTRNAWSMDWSPQGHLAVGTTDGLVAIWDHASALGDDPPDAIVRVGTSVTELRWSAAGHLAVCDSGPTVAIYSGLADAGRRDQRRERA